MSRIPREAYLPNPTAEEEARGTPRKRASKRKNLGRASRAAPQGHAQNQCQPRRGAALQRALLHHPPRPIALSLRLRQFQECRPRGSPQPEDGRRLLREWLCQTAQHEKAGKKLSHALNICRPGREGHSQKTVPRSRPPALLPAFADPTPPH